MVCDGKAVGQVDDLVPGICDVTAPVCGTQDFRAVLRWRSSRVKMHGVSKKG